MYLWLSQSNELMQTDAQHHFVTTSYRGHWAPLAFLTEFWTTKLIGARGVIWHYRQLLLLTIVGLAAFTFVVNVARALGMGPAQERSVAVAVCALLLLQPLMFEFVVWPFMGLQLIWMIFALVASLGCVRLANDPQKVRWIWIAAGAAYGSLHTLGLGVAVTLATAGVFAFLIIVSYQRDCLFKSVRRHLFFAALLLVLLTCVHCLAMVFLLPQRNIIPFTSLTPGALKLGLECTFRFMVAGLQSLTLGLQPLPNNYPFEQLDDWMHSPFHWALGLFGSLGLIWTIYYLCRRAFLRPGSVHVLRASTALFCAIGVVVLVVLMFGRQTISEGDAYGMLPFFMALPRFVIPLQMFLIGPLVVVAGFFACRFRTMFNYGCILYALSALVVQTEYQQSAAALLTPQARVSHRSAWRQLVEAARECRAAHLPLPNFLACDVDGRMAWNGGENVCSVATTRAWNSANG